MGPRFLILETSHHSGRVALAQGEAIVGERTLDESRRHARDLAPAICDMLQSQGWRAREFDGVIVSRGPGSYTGLRGGLMSAKTLAYATGCALLAIDTFAAIAACGVAGAANLDVIADAQQGNIYVQRFGAHPEPLAIMAFALWLESALASHVAVTGPGLEQFADRLPSELTLLPRERWLPTPASLLKIGIARYLNKECDDPFAVEPLYLRASSAEEKWDKLHPPASRIFSHCGERVGCYNPPHECVARQTARGGPGVSTVWPTASSGAVRHPCRAPHGARRLRAAHLDHADRARHHV